MSEAGDVEPVDLAEVHRAVGMVVAAATGVERQLAEAVSSLARSPLTSLLVQGEGPNTLIAMARRLLKRGIGSSAEDEQSGKTERLGLISAEDTARFIWALDDATRLLADRNAVVHSVWLANLGEPGTIAAHRMTRSGSDIRNWTVEELENLRQALTNNQADLFICTWNTSGSGMPRIDPRSGDVT